MDEQYEEALDSFQAFFGPVADNEIKHFKAPGRVNLIGEHLDYNGGWVFPAAISLGVYALVSFKDSKKDVRLCSQDKQVLVSLSLDQPVIYHPEAGWANYPKGVMAELLEQGLDLPGADIYFFSTLPEGSGLSSSAAIEVLTATIFDSYVNGFAPPSAQRQKEIALLCQKAENTFIGMQCGIMDQFAIAMGQKDHAILLDTDTLSYNYIPIQLEETSLIILNSNKPRELADSAFNQRRQECNQALQLLQKEQDISTLAAASLESLAQLDSDTLVRRSRHVITENQRVQKATQALADNDLASFAQLLLESHISLQRDFEVTGFELDSLVDAALNAPGCLGARMTGAGFGGCAIALVQDDSRAEFLEQTQNTYYGRTGLAAEAYPVQIDDGARLLRAEQ